MGNPFDGHSALYERGMAYGAANIKTDTIIFRFKEEVFEFPLSVGWPIAHFNGYFYQASIDDVRKIEAELAGKKETSHG